MIGHQASISNLAFIVTFVIIVIIVIVVLVLVVIDHIECSFIRFDFATERFRIGSTQLLIDEEKIGAIRRIGTVRW